MSRIEDLLRLTGCAIVALAIIAAATAAHAQSDDAVDPPEAVDTPEMDTVETDIVAAADPSAEENTTFDQPVDLSTPFTMPSGHTIDPSRFTQGLSSTTWTSRAGIDNRDVTPYADLRLERWMPGALPQQTVGVAWASIAAPGLMAWDKTAIETRLDPYQQSRFGITLSRSVLVGSDVSVTLQNGFGWTQPLLQGVPTVAHGANGSVEENHAVRFTFLPMSTTLSIGAAASSADDRWLRSLSAEQRLFGGPLSITGAVSETATGDFSRSLKAGFKRNW
jgi:hypothetical protein